MLRGSKSLKPREQLRVALQTGQHDEALRLYALLRQCEPNEPRWPHRNGDLLLRMGRKSEAMDAFGRAVQLYAAQGFHARAAAMTRVIINIDSSRTDVLERVCSQETKRPRHSTF
jgi:Flp pilus assembly protein TadD